MALFDLPLDRAPALPARRDEPDDFDAFWASTLAEARAADLASPSSRSTPACASSRRST